MPAAQPSPLMSFVPILAIFAVFYFLIIRPQQKQAREHKRMLEALKKGDRILTNGGLYGVVVSLRGQDVELKIAEGVSVLVARSAVNALANPPALASAQADGAKTV